MQDLKEELLTLLKKDAYRRGDYTLTSGKISEHYVNCKPVTLSSRGLFCSSCLLLDLVEEDSVAIGGLTLGADPLVSGMAVVSAIDGVKLDALIIRKEAKGHGTGAYIEGPILETYSKVTVVEDVITTGGSAIKAVTRLRDAGYVVDRVISIVDRQENNEASEWMKLEGLELISLFTINDLCE